MSSNLPLNWHYLTIYERKYASSLTDTDVAIAFQLLSERKSFQEAIDENFDIMCEGRGSLNEREGSVRLTSSR